MGKCGRGLLIMRGENQAILSLGFIKSFRISCFMYSWMPTHEERSENKTMSPTQEVSELNRAETDPEPPTPDRT